MLLFATPLYHEVSDARLNCFEERRSEHCCAFMLCIDVLMGGGGRRRGRMKTQSISYCCSCFPVCCFLFFLLHTSSCPPTIPLEPFCTVQVVQSTREFSFRVNFRSRHRRLARGGWGILALRFNCSAAAVVTAYCKRRWPRHEIMLVFSLCWPPRSPKK